VGTYPILQRFVTHESARLLHFGFISLLLLRVYLLEWDRSNVKNPFHLATVLSARQRLHVFYLTDLGPVKSMVDDVKKTLVVHGTVPFRLDLPFPRVS
jgi:hypothetical protein